MLTGASEGYRVKTQTLQNWQRDSIFLLVQSLFNGRVFCKTLVALHRDLTGIFFVMDYLY